MDQVTCETSYPNCITYIPTQEVRQGVTLEDRNLVLPRKDQSMTEQKSIMAMNRQKVKEMRSNARQKSSEKRHHSSLWSTAENQAYLKYLLANEEWFFGSKQVKREVRIYVMMSQAIVTRSAAQCRSHHQKMTKHHGDIQGIIGYLKRLLMPKPHEQDKTDQPYDPDAYRWLECLTWMDMQREKWQSRYAQEWFLGVHEEV